MLKKYFNTLTLDSVIRVVLLFVFLLGLNNLIYGEVKIFGSIFGAFFGIWVGDWIKIRLLKSKQAALKKKNNSSDINK